MNMQTEIQESLSYLQSDQALKCLEADPYWPKWNSPWWHMSLLHEMGETMQIPVNIVKEYVRSLNKIPLKLFPIQPEEMPADVDPYRGTPCHCQLGNVYQVLAAWGVNVDHEVPWIRPWFLRYQMADGGLNCDNSAYLVTNEVPSSMVGTIAVFEAILLYTPHSWSSEEQIFLEQGAHFLMRRKLLYGSDTKHNAEERVSAEKWLKPCFPRFYHYDLLRGLNALLIWAEKTKQTIPLETVQEVISYLKQHFPDGQIRIERQSYEGSGTLLQSPNGEWLRKQPATFFPLLNRVSGVGERSPFLTKQWAEACLRISAHSNLRQLL